jgi:hypothetical protein
MSDKKPKTLSYGKAIELMRLPGTRMVKMHGRNGCAFYIIPGGHVERDTAAKIIEHPSVWGAEDGLFPRLQPDLAHGCPISTLAGLPRNAQNSGLPVRVILSSSQE